MAVNSVSGMQFTPTYATYEAKSKDAVAEATQGTEAGVIYEKAEEASAKAPYSVNKMSKEDRSALVEQLKADQASRMDSLMNLVKNTITGQSKSYGIAVNDDDVWKLFADGKFTVDEATRKKAEEDISEDGYWGIKQTSQRLFDFASALAGDDVEVMKDMQRAMEKGFRQATKSWGKELPQISRDTKAAADKLFEDYYKSKNVQ